MHRSQAERDKVAAIFAEADVARSYGARAPYAPALLAFVADLAPRRRRALDLGCGPGTIAIPLADRFEAVVALDPSGPMIAAGRAADAGRHPNIEWVQARAEDYDDARGFDLVTAGTAIHWPDHAVLFPKLAGWTSVLAVIGNGALALPCAEAAALGFLKRWLARMAERTPDIRSPYDPVAFAAEGRRHEAWIDLAGRREFRHRFRQSLADYITGQHSAATWSRAAMGDALAAEFDAELEALLAPYATDAMLELEVVSEVSWGAPRTTARG